MSRTDDPSVPRDARGDRPNDPNAASNRDARDGRDLRDGRDVRDGRDGRDARGDERQNPDDLKTFSVLFSVEEAGTKRGTPWVILRPRDEAPRPAETTAREHVGRLTGDGHSPEGCLELDIHPDAVRHFYIGALVRVTLTRVAG